MTPSRKQLVVGIRRTFFIGSCDDKKRKVEESKWATKVRKVLTKIRGNILIRILFKSFELLAHFVCIVGVNISY